MADSSLKFLVFGSVELKAWEWLNLCQIFSELFVQRSVHLAKLNIAIAMQRTETKGLSLSPMTAALRMMPRKPVLCSYIEFGHADLT